MAKRHAEIDLLRTIAIAMMVLYHTAYDLHVFYHWDIDLWGTQWNAIRITTVSLFLFVSGVSSQFSRKPLKRALIVLSCAFIITIATYIYDPSTFIRFGILHCIGTGMLFLIPLKKLKEWNILLGIMIITNSQFSIINVQFVPPHQTLDYYPLLPWFGIMLIGSGLSHFFYIRKSLSLHLTLPFQPIITFPGRHALVIYMIHQPIVVGVLGILGLLGDLPQ